MTLDDSLILLQIDLLRHDAYLRHEVMRRLGKTQRAALALLINGKADAAKMQSVIRAGYDDVGEWLQEAFEELMPVAAVAFVNVYSNHLGGGFEAPDKLKVPEVYGASVSAWLTQQANKQAFILRRLARVGRDEKQDITQVAAEVRKQWRTGNAQTEALIRTANAAAANEANIAVMLKSKRVKYLIHKSHLDSRTTGVCRARHNKRWTKELKPVEHHLEFKQPPLHWNCRSIIKPLLDDKLRDEDDYDFDEWLEKMPASVRNKALGKEKAALWLAAKKAGQALTIHDLLDQKGRELTLHELARRYPEATDAAVRAKPITKQAQQVKIAEGSDDVREWLGEDAYRHIAGQLENPRIKKQMRKYGMSQAEGVVLRHYTGAGYLQVNNYLREGGDNPALEKVVQTMRQGLAKLPDYQGVAVRRTHLPEIVLTRHTVGNVVKYPEFTSATFGGQDIFGDTPHRLVIQSKRGKKIDWLSHYGKFEEEVLFTSPTRFRIRRRWEQDGKIHLDMIEWEDEQHEL